MRSTIRTLLAGAAAASVVVVGLQSAHAATGVTIIKNINIAYDDESYFPDTLRPKYSKSGPVVIDKAVLTVRNNETNELVGAGRTFVDIDPGEYKVTTTVKYRTFTTVGTTTKTVAETGDTIPGGPGPSAGPYISSCAITGTPSFTEEPEPPYERVGTFHAKCAIRWGTEIRSSETDYTNISGVFGGDYNEGDSKYHYVYQLGDEWNPDGPGGLGTGGFSTFGPFSGLAAPASHDVKHTFPVRKYSSQKSQSATHLVRRIIR